MHQVEIVVYAVFLWQWKIFENGGLYNIMILFTNFKHFLRKHDGIFIRNHNFLFAC